MEMWLDEDPVSYNMSKIFDGLYLGAFYPSTVKAQMQKCGVTHILTVGKCMSPMFKSDFKYMVIEIDDRPTENLRQYFDDAFDFIDDALRTGTIYVHCAAGKS